MNPFKTVLTAGFALFSMFFGSGNLVFPFVLGREVTGAFPIAILGFIFTAVFMPVLGFLGVTLSQGSPGIFFNKLGKTGTFLFILLCLSLMGPFGVMPRCVGLSYGGFAMNFPDVPLWVFSLGFCTLAGILIWQPNKVVPIIGIFLTPFKLGGIIFLILIGLYFAKTPVASTYIPLEALNSGAKIGYQTMDLMSALFFCGSIVEYLKLKLGKTDQKMIFIYSIYSGFIGVLLLAIAYTGFIILGASYAPEIMYTPSEKLLVTISSLAFGSLAVPIVGFTICVSCLATSTILGKLFTDFLKDKVLMERITYHQSVVITMCLCFAFSLLGFDGIVQFLATILMWLYPALIVYTVYKVYDGIRSEKFYAA